MMKNKINTTDDTPAPQPDDTIISDILAPGEGNQLKADAWKERHNAIVVPPAKTSI